MLTYTTDMRKKMDGISFANDYDFIEKIIEVGKSFRPFSEAMDAFICEHGYDKDINDTEAKVHFIEEAFKAANIKPTRGISRWYEEGKDIKKKTGYQICFAFGLNKDDTEDFFRRIFAKERGFDCHDLDEAVYYYCLKNGLSYDEAQKIQEQVQKTPKCEKKDKEIVYTSSIISDLDNIASKEELISYLNENNELFSENNITAYEIIQKLWKKIAGNNGLLWKERDSLDSIQDDIPIDYKAKISIHSELSFHEAYIAILQLDETQVSQLNSPKSIKPILENMHQNLRDCFPNEQSIEKIVRNVHPMDDEAIRKWIILLSFYKYWVKIAIERGNYKAEQEDRERCIFTINSYLMNAGYSELYEGNPYDWIYFYATGDKYPLETFRWIWTRLMDKKLGV